MDILLTNTEEKMQKTVKLLNHYLIFPDHNYEYFSYFFTIKLNFPLYFRFSNPLRRNGFELFGFIYMFFKVKIKNRKAVILKTGRVAVTVLFIICPYLLNPCDISAYTC